MARETLPTFVVARRDERPRAPSIARSAHTDEFDARGRSVIT